MEQTIRKPDYYKDIDKYGKFGEDIFIQKFFDKLQIIDVRENKAYQKEDIDFLVARENEKFKSIEVKVDCRAWETGNLLYESISHGCNGWAISTKADFIFMVIVKENGDNLIPVVAYWIDMEKWKEYCSRRDTKKALNIIENEKIVDIRCKISDLKDAKVIEKEIFL